MILNHIKVAAGIFWRQPSFSLVNVIGLAVCLAAFWHIGVFVFYERSLA